MSTNPLIRKIIHVDMDAFFASVEQRDNPELKGLPVVVGGDSKRSVVAAASYEARKFGIFSAMPMALARKKCADLVIVPHRFQVYKEVSQVIRNIFKQYTDLIEPLSLDEAYLDVTQNKFNNPSATLIAGEIKEKVQSETQLTCSAGVSINKFLAKIASDLDKPDGLSVIAPAQIPDFVAQLPIEKFYGVGKSTERKMHELGIYSGADLQEWTELDLVKHFGKSGRYYYNVCRGIDHRPVSPSRIRKSISIERTFEEDLNTREDIIDVLEALTGKLCTTLQRMDIKGRTIQLKWRYPDFNTPTRSKSFKQYTDDEQLLTEQVLALADENIQYKDGVRLLGVGMQNLNTEQQDNQLLLPLDEQ